MKMLPVLLCFFIFSCTQKKEEKQVDKAAEIASLLEADRSFSDLSTEKGMKQAFIETIDSNGVMLRPGMMPLMGAATVDFLIQLNDTGFVMNWKPNHAYVSTAADLGYTYGVYAIHPSSSDTTLYGTYVNIWKKQADGKWKLALDSGNDGIEE